MRFRSGLAAALVWFLTPCHASSPALSFGFEGPDALDGWHSTPTSALRLDSTVANSGTSSLRLVNDASSALPYVTFSRALTPSSGRFIELRAFVRSESVNGRGSLWLRQDSRGKPVLLDNMRDRALSGTSGWTLLQIRQALVPEADRIVFGGLLSGSGQVWFDDLQVIVDGPGEVESSASTESPLPPLTTAQVDSVSLLIEVWGFLKFHHTAATSGRVDWDGELIRLVPLVAGTSARSEALATIGRWVAELGTSACHNCPESASHPAGHALEPAVDWIRDEARLGPELSALLVGVYQARAWTGSQHFVSFAPNVGNLVSKNEAQHSASLLPSPALRLLAVARIWTTIQYWAPYRELTQQPWEAALPSAVAAAVAADGQQAYHRTLLRLLAKVNDGHAMLFSVVDHRPPSGDCQVRAVVRMVEAAPTVVSASVESGLETGDRILALDGEPIANRMPEWLAHYSASSSAARMSRLSVNMTRGACGKAEITVDRDGEERLIESSRIASPVAPDLLARDLPGPAFRMLAGGLAYLKLSQARVADIASHLDAAGGSAGLIIDLRGYPREFVVFELAGRLVSASTPFAKFSVVSPDAPGAFFFSNAVELQPKEPRFAGKVAVLIDESTMSQAEYTAMALRAAGAILVGSPTAGADGNVSRVELPGGLKFGFSGIGVFYPDGTATQGVGLIPDIEAAPSREGVTACRDEVLEAAALHLAGISVSPESVSVCRSMDTPPR